MPLGIIQGLWIGDKLTAMEKLSIQSYISNGHEYHLYAYNKIDNVPSDAVVKDGNSIIPKEEIFSYKTGEGKNSFSAFSNFFRYKLLLEKGGWWSDTDMICLRPLDFEDEYVFSTELYQGADHITSGLIKAPVGSEAISYAWNTCCNKDPDKIVWGEVGPRLVREMVEFFSLQSYAKPHKVFMPVGFEMWMQFLMPRITMDLEKSYTVHLWNEMWRRNNMDKNKSYDPGCLYEKLKRRYKC